jgi:ribosomal subunit interface protein
MRFMSKGMELADTSKAYIQKRLGRIEKLVDSMSEIEVETDCDKKGMYRVEIMVKTPHDLYRSENIAENIEAATDVALDELETQISRTKDRRHDLKIRGGRSIKKSIVVDSDARF